MMVLSFSSNIANAEIMNENAGKEADGFGSIHQFVLFFLSTENLCSKPAHHSPSVKLTQTTPFKKIVFMNKIVIQALHGNLFFIAHVNADRKVKLGSNET